ncbi:transposase [Streptomyces sp. NPDC059783]|uniref:transposase n=1 Tax=Streptomyces sp. NPDC059783 TaxID=3346944 RepID=UPI00366960B3
MINGRKRHIAVDTQGFLVMFMVTPAGMQDRDAARELLWRLRLTHSQITQVWADSAYAGKLVPWAEDFLHITLKSVFPLPGPELGSTLTQALLPCFFAGL